MQMDATVDVILPLPLNQRFTYRVPAELLHSVASGKRAVVQFGAKKYYAGIIASVSTNVVDTSKLKDIVSVLDDKPVINSLQFRFWKWISEYYMCPEGVVMKAALPAGLKLESETQFYINPEFETIEELSENEYIVFDIIKSQIFITLNDIASRINLRNYLSVVKSLIEKEAIYTGEALKTGYTPKKETYVRLTDEAKDENKLNGILDNLKRAKKQADLLLTYLRISEFAPDIPEKPVKKKVLLESCETSSSVLNALTEKRILECYEVETSRLIAKDTPISDLKQLSSVQQEACNLVVENFASKDVVLLHGVTSSGKTEIYLHLIKDAINKGKQVLYLLPEIAITTQIINRLRVHFGNDVGVYHSKFSDNERVEIWNKLNAGDLNAYKIILGVRSSVFLPFSNLGLVIVDEEHENTYKQYEPAPHYHARDAAIMLATMHKGKTLLGTATPSVESYYNTTIGKYGLVELMQRYQGIQLPEIKLVNTRVAKKKNNMKSHFSTELLDHISIALESKKQVILFQNRRGFSPYIECADCGWIPHCKHCDVTLTLHKNIRQLVCHYCGYALPIASKCNDCGSPSVQTMGFGTEKIEEELAIFYPQARISRMDLDSTRQKYAHEQIISSFENQEVDILVGTQMVTKGLDFENVALVGILNADNMLNFPDFRAYERSYQLITQVSGRAGRKGERGKVIIQTTMPGNAIIKNVTGNDFESFIKEQLSEREIFKYPPFYRLIRITLKHKDADSCDKFAHQLVESLRQLLGSRVMGPDRPLVGRIQNYYLKNILLKLERKNAILEVKNQISEIIQNVHSGYKSAQVTIDVDP